jgi:uncharacterized secreted protein with C-terminal beta-propeller domain
MGDAMIEIEELDLFRNLVPMDKIIENVKAYIVFDREEESLWYLSAIQWDGNTLEWDEARELEYTELAKIIWESVLLTIDEEATELAQDHFLDEVHDY